MANINNEEPSSAPQPDRWYDLTLGPSFTDHSKFCTLRYDFKPASIDKSERGLLQKDRNKRVTVEYNNNQPGKPKLVFEGVSEDYKENEAVLFFDGHSFRLERLHRAVKRLKHVRLPGEPAAPTLVGTPPPLAADKGTKFQEKYVFQYVHSHIQIHALALLVQMEHTVTEEEEERNVIPPNPDYEAEEKDMDTAFGGSEESIDILNVDEDDGCETTSNKRSGSGRVLDIDINVPHQAEMDDENAEVDINADVEEDEEEGNGPNAAEALKAQVGAEVRKEEDDDESTSSGTNSGSDSSGSEPGSSSSSSGTETTSGGDSSSN
ncbi:Ell-associated factor Eaf [Linum perenne]